MIDALRAEIKTATAYGRPVRRIEISPAAIPGLITALSGVISIHPKDWEEVKEEAQFLDPNPLDPRIQADLFGVPIYDSR